MAEKEKKEETGKNPKASNIVGAVNADGNPTGGKEEAKPEEEQKEERKDGAQQAGVIGGPKKEEPKKEAPKEEAKEEESEELSPELEELAKKYDKLISEIEKLSVVELAELVQVLEKKFGVSAAAPVAAAGAGEGDAEVKDSFSIMLQAPGDLKINVIKIVREITGLGLKESKELVDSAPKIIKEGVKKEEANEFKKQLEEAGATAELQ